MMRIGVVFSFLFVTLLVETKEPDEPKHLEPVTATIFDGDFPDKHIVMREWQERPGTRHHGMGLQGTASHAHQPQYQR